MVTKLLGGLVLLTGLAAAQPFGLGLKVGVPATDAFQVSAIGLTGKSESHFYLVGPYAEVRLPGGLGLEMDALYRTYNVQGASAHSWEFPIVLKHRILPGPIKPYFEAGASFSNLSDINVSSLLHRQNFGIVAGAGVDIKALPVRIAPEIRYTGWWFHNFDGAVHSDRNQVAILVGIGF